MKYVAFNVLHSIKDFKIQFFSETVACIVQRHCTSCIFQTPFMKVLVCEVPLKNPGNFFQITSYVVSELRTNAEQICVIEISEQHGENLHYHKWQLKCCPPVLPTRPDVPKRFQCLEMGKQMLILAMQFPPIVTSPESMAARSALDRLDFCDKLGNFVQIINYYLVQIAAIFGSVHDT